MKTTEAQSRATQKYLKANIKRIVVNLNKKTDEDIIRFLDGLENVQGEIKRIIREEMKRIG